MGSMHAGKDVCGPGRTGPGIFMVSVFALFWLISSAPALYAAAMEQENRLIECRQVVLDIMGAPDGGIPADLFRRSAGIVVFPSVLKAGLGFGGHYGKGVVLRRDPKTGRWGPPVFLRLIGGSFGWQIGVQATDLVLLTMNEISLKALFKDTLTIGADASVAAGPVGRDASAGTDLGLSVGMLSYSRAKGLFAGVSVKGSVIEVDWAANGAYYGSEASLIDMFFSNKGTTSPAAGKLIQTLNNYNRK
ncbi:MAG: lipid-binding SYLF domain-containing protein [Pseudomonadota bacterium]